MWHIGSKVNRGTRSVIFARIPPSLRSIFTPQRKQMALCIKYVSMKGCVDVIVLIEELYQWTGQKSIMTDHTKFDETIIRPHPGKCHIASRSPGYVVYSDKIHHVAWKISTFQFYLTVFTSFHWIHCFGCRLLIRGECYTLSKM